MELGKEIYRNTFIAYDKDNFRILAFIQNNYTKIEDTEEIFQNFENYEVVQTNIKVPSNYSNYMVILEDGNLKEIQELEE